MQADFAASLARVLVYEGGKSDNPSDPGGRTNRGVTQATYNAYLAQAGKPAKDVYTISDAEVADIYQVHYWNVIKGDALPAGLDLCVFDAAVNSGPGQAGKWLQHALGATFVGTADGLMGVKTLQAVADFGDVETLINNFCERRLATLHSLRTWSEFGTGWSARIANVLKASDALSQGDTPANPVDVTRAGGNRKAPITDQKPSMISRTGTHITTVATSASAAAASASTNLAPVQAALPNFKYIGYALGVLAATSAVAGFIVHTINDLKTAAAQGSATAAVNLDADQNLPQVVPAPAPKAA